MFSKAKQKLVFAESGLSERYTDRLQYSRKTVEWSNALFCFPDFTQKNEAYLWTAGDWNKSRNKRKWTLG